jgi:hypothetical protein
MKNIITFYGILTLYYNEKKHISSLKLGNENNSITIRRNNNVYEIISSDKEKIISNNGLNYYSKSETTCIKNGNLSSIDSIFHLIYDYYEYELYVEDKLIVRTFIVDNKYQSYLDLIESIDGELSNMFKKSIIQNMIEDLYNDIKNNLFIGLLDICNINNKYINSNKNNIEIGKANIITEEHLDLTKTFLDNEFLLKIIIGLEDMIKTNIEQIFEYFETT